MTTPADTQAQTTETPKAPTISDPNISFADYQVLRRGGTLPESEAKKSEPAPDAGQKVPSESDTGERKSKSETDETADVDADETDETAEGTDKDGKPKKKSGGGFQKRISKLTADKAALRQEAEYWRNAATRAGAADPKSSSDKEPTKTQAKGEPQAGDFETHSEFVKALSNWAADEKLSAYKKEQQDKAQQSKQSEALKAHLDRVSAFIKKTADYEDVISEAGDLPISAVVQELVISSEDGPAIIYELAKNPGELDRINRMEPLAAAREIGRLESKIAKVLQENKPEPKTTTQAPKPPSPVGSGKGTAAKSLDDPDLPFKEYVRLRREQQKRRRG